jgi:hypothetical protein
MKIPMKSRWKTTIALAATSVALMGPAYAQDSQGLPVPIPDAGVKQKPDPAPSSSTRITGKVRSVDGHLLTLTDGVQLVFFPGFTEQHGELRPGATIKASYAETAGRKVVTSIRVDPL